MNQPPATIRILGIDPGSINTGYGIIDHAGNHSRHITHGTIHLGRRALAWRLREMQERIVQLFETYHPAEAAVEKAFVHKNADSALKLGQARGALIAACAGQDMAIFEYTPNQVKKAVVGRGHAAKQQIQHMTRTLLCLSGLPETDAADALAVALCHAHSRHNPVHRAGAQLS